MSKQLHWTKRPENKEKLARMLKRAAKARRAARRAKVAAQKPKTQMRRAKTEQRLIIDTETNHGQAGQPTHEQVAYAFGRVEAWLHTYEDAAQLSRGSVASRVGAALQGQTGR